MTMCRRRASIHLAVMSAGARSRSTPEFEAESEKTNLAVAAWVSQWAEYHSLQSILANLGSVST